MARRRFYEGVDRRTAFASATPQASWKAVPLAERALGDALGPGDARSALGASGTARPQRARRTRPRRSAHESPRGPGLEDGPTRTSASSPGGVAKLSFRAEPYRVDERDRQRSARRGCELASSRWKKLPRGRQPSKAVRAAAVSPPGAASRRARGRHLVRHGRSAGPRPRGEGASRVLSTTSAPMRSSPSWRGTQSTERISLGQ